MIGAVTLEGNTIVVQLTTGTIQEVVVVDTKKGMIVSRVKLKPERQARGEGCEPT